MDRSSPKRSWLIGTIVTCLILGIGLLTPAIAAAATGWTDVDQETLEGYGLSLEHLDEMSDGYTDGSWQPWQPLTRAQYARFLCGDLVMDPATPQTPTFLDVAPTDVHFGYIEALAGAGILQGKGDGLFAPDEPITRQEAVAISMRALVKRYGRVLSAVMSPEAIEYQLDAYADSGDISPSLRTEIALACARAALKGEQVGDDYYLFPNAPLLRIQGAALLTRDVKPTLGTLASDDFDSLAGEGGIGSRVIRWFGKGVADWGLDTGLDSLKDWIAGDHDDNSWAEVKDQLSDIQSSLDQIQQSVNVIESDLKALAQQYSAMSHEIESLIQGQFAQHAISEITGYYGLPGTADTYYYFASLTDKPSDPNALNSQLNTFLQQVVNPSSGLIADLLDIQHAIIPVSTSRGALDQFVMSVCSGALSDDELMGAYQTIEAYFCQLVHYQMEAVQMYCEGLNATDPTHKLATEFLTKTWFPMLQAECDNFLNNSVSLCLHVATFPSTQHILGEDATREVLARAVYCYDQLTEQIVDRAGQQPQSAYGLQAIEIAPHGIHLPSQFEGLATVGSQHVSIGQANVHQCGAASGPPILVWDDSKATVDITTQYDVRLIWFNQGTDWSKVAQVKMCDKADDANVVYDTLGEVDYYDDSYNKVSAQTQDAVAFALGVKDCAHQSAQTGTSLWWLPACLGRGANGLQWNQSSFDNPQHYATDKSNPSSGHFEVHCDSNGAVARPSSGVSYHAAWTLPRFTYVGKKPATFNLTFQGREWVGLQNWSFAGYAMLANLRVENSGGYTDVQQGKDIVDGGIDTETDDPGVFGFDSDDLCTVALELHPGGNYNLILKNNLQLNWVNNKISQAYWFYEAHYDWTGMQLVPAGS